MQLMHVIPNPLTPALSPEYRGEGEILETPGLETALAPALAVARRAVKNEYRTSGVNFPARK
jgi:hypothetical protein